MTGIEERTAMLSWLFWLKDRHATSGRFTCGHLDKIPSKDVEMLNLAMDYADQELRTVYRAGTREEIARLDFWESMRDSMVAMGATPPKPVESSRKASDPRTDHAYNWSFGDTTALIIRIAFFGASCLFCSWLKDVLTVQLGRTEWYGRTLALAVASAIPFWVSYIPFGSLSHKRDNRHGAKYFTVVWLLTVLAIAVP